MKFSELEGHVPTDKAVGFFPFFMINELRSLKLDVREARLEAKEQYNRFRLLIWLPIITGALQVLVAILHR